MNMICQDCGEDIERNMNDVWVHEDAGQLHDAKPTIREWDAEQQFEDLLDDVYNVVSVCGYNYDAGRALRILDPVAFRQGMLDYFDSEGIEIV